MRIVMRTGCAGFSGGVLVVVAWRLRVGAIRWCRTGVAWPVCAAAFELLAHKTILTARALALDGALATARGGLR